MVVAVSLGVTGTKNYAANNCWLTLENNLIYWAFVAPAATVVFVSVHLSLFSNEALILTVINAFRPLFILLLNFNSLSYPRIVLFSRRPKDLNLPLVCLSGQFHSFCFLTATYKSCFKVPRQNDSHATSKSVAATIKCSSSSPGNHVVIWFSDVHFLYNCVPLFVHSL